MIPIFIAAALLGLGGYVALTNEGFVQVTAFDVVYDQPVAIVILLSMALGMLAGFLSMLSMVIARAVTIGTLRRKIREYEIANEADKDVVYRSAGLGQDGENVI